MSEYKPKLLLTADSLLSKWGFSDGDMPDWIADEIDDAGLPHNSSAWHTTLVRLVREKLVPALSAAVEVVEIDTLHNPIRASHVNGADVESYWYQAHTPELLPEAIEVPLFDVLHVYREALSDAVDAAERVDGAP